MVRQFEQFNCRIIGASTDSHYSHKEWTLKDRNQGGLGKVQFPLISDQNRRISKQYGCLIEDSSHPNAGAALRATYLIDDKGILRYSAINDLQVGRDANAYLQIVKALYDCDHNIET